MHNAKTYEQPLPTFENVWFLKKLKLSIIVYINPNLLKVFFYSVYSTLYRKGTTNFDRFYLEYY